MIQFDGALRTITLSTCHTSYQMKIDDTGVLLHTYYGQKLRGGDLSRLICPEDRGFSPNPDEVGLDRTWSLDTQPQEYSSSTPYSSSAVRPLWGSFSVTMRVWAVTPSP